MQIKDQELEQELKQEQEQEQEQELKFTLDGRTQWPLSTRPDRLPSWRVAQVERKL